MEKVKEKIIICDIDGCLIDSAWIWKVVNKMNLDKDLAFDIFNRLANAEANDIDLTLLNYLRFKQIAGIKILFLTARSEKIETETINFISRRTGLVYGVDFSISSRPNEDFTSSAESKRIRLQSVIDAGKEILFAIDDKDDIISMYEEFGIETVKWAIGFVPFKLVLEFGNQLAGLVGIKEEVSQN